MSQILPHFRIRSGEGIGNELFFQFPDIYANERTFLDVDTSAGANSISANGINFSTSQYIVIGSPGQLKSEIIQIHSSTAPTSSTIYLATATLFAHNRGDIIRFIPYNQIAFSSSSDSGTTWGSETNINIRSDSLETYQQQSSDASTLFYRFRFYNNSNTTYSPYSDKIASTGFADNSLYSIINRALNGLGETYSELLNKPKLIEFLGEGRREVDQDKRVWRFSFRTKFMFNAGTITPGTWKLTVPPDLRDPNTNKNILRIYFGKDKQPLIYQDKFRFDENYQNISHSTLSVQAASGATTITLVSSGDFASPTGSITVAAQTATGTNTAISYTANNLLTGVITLPALAITLASGTEVWQNANFGEPTAYTIDNGIIYFDVPFNNAMGGQNIYMDYYSTMSPLVNDNSTLDEPEYDMYVSYLKFRVKELKSNGKLDRDTDPDYKDWVSREEDFITKQTTGQFIYFVPDIAGLSRSK